MKLQKTALLIFTGLFLTLASCASDQNKSQAVVAYEGYTLFNPQGNNTTYLINNAGEVLHTWKSKYRTGDSVYLLENGNLLRTATLKAEFGAAGGAGRIEELSWEGEIVWSFEYSDDKVHFHHDIEVLPNGNILVIAWERVTPEEAISAGRDPKLIPAEDEGQLWMDHLIEVNKAGEIVWEWHVSDHLIQDVDSSKDNYGVVADHPELININYLGYNRVSNDWNHVNAVDYNPELDQILISVRDFGEIWIIDHNTTTEEAAGDKGDLLYRWGNPATYDRGDGSDQQFFGQHDAKWITDDLSGAGNIMVFNNGDRNRPYSSVDEITPPLKSDGSYDLGSGAYDPTELTWHYEAPVTSDFYSDHISGAQRLPNGNTMICAGAEGRFFEVTAAGEIVWDIMNPIETKSPKGGTKTSVFRAEKYAPDYPGLARLEK
ncbi:MAG: aryl-sulfate sulfotransferase [Spirochaetales bacterium]|nr:aryl-sulfate sulfotransferase [Spirochaetales bacterium]